MKNLIFLCLFALSLLQACDKSIVSTCENCSFTCLDENEANVISNACMDNWECNFKVMAQSEVDLNENEGFKSGDKNVFQMKNSTLGDLNIADDEYVDILVFELDETQNSFSADNNELNDMQVHFKKICFCDNVMFNEATSGCIQGEKQSDGIWSVQGNLVFEDMNIKFEAEFTN